jgi:CAAX protease family protein
MKSIFWQILTYMIITLIVTTIIALFQQKLFQVFKLEILNFEKIEGAPIILPQLAPAIAFLIIILLIKSLRISINFDFNSTIAMKSLVALVIPIFLASIIFIVSRLLGMEHKLTSATMPTITFAIVTILIGALGEEIGWRGFLQPLLEKNSSALFASVIVGLLWGLWHVGHYKNGALFMIAFLIFTVSASIIIAWIYRDTKFNVIIPILFHTSINLCFFMIFKNSLADFKFMSITAVVWMIPAICIVLLTGKDLIKS